MAARRDSEKAGPIAVPYRNSAFWLLLASLLPFLFPFLLALCFYFLVLLFPLLFAFLFLLLFHLLSHAFLSTLTRFVPLCISRFVCLAWPYRQSAAASLDRYGAESCPRAPLEPVEVQELVRDGRAKTLPSRPASAIETSDVCFLPGDEQWDDYESTEKLSFSAPPPAREVETGIDIPSTLPSFLSEADKGREIVQETPQNDKGGLFFNDSIDKVLPCGLEPPSVREIFNEISTPESGEMSNLGRERLEYPEANRIGISKSVSSVLLESVPLETTNTKEAEDVSDALTSQGTNEQLIASRIEDFLSLKTEDLAESSAEDVSGKCDIISVHSDWEDESTNDHELEGIPRRQVSYLDNQHASKLRYDAPVESADVPQPIVVEPMDLSTLQRTEGCKPTSGEEAAFPAIGFSIDCLIDSGIATSADTYGSADDELSTRIPNKMCEDQAFKLYTSGEELSRGPQVGDAESDIGTSKDETSRPTFSDFGVKSLKETDKESFSEVATNTRAKSVLESNKVSTGDSAVQVRSTKEINMLADIDAIKKIIGYQGDLQGYLVEKIRALYVFVGMEPSLSVVNADDLEKAWEELEVLKVVIGLE